MIIFTDTKQPSLYILNILNETAAALRTIGADKMAVIYDKAVSALGCKIPKDWDERRSMLDDVITDDTDRVLSECDNVFYEYSDNLEELNYQFIRYFVKHEFILLIIALSRHFHRENACFFSTLIR